MSRVFITRTIPQPAIDRLMQVFTEVEVNPLPRNLSHAEIISGLQGSDILISMLTDTIDRDVIDSNPRLKGICNYAVGYNNIDYIYANSRGIAVCNTPGVLTETTADLTWALLMSAARRIVEGDAMMRSVNFPGWEPLMLLGVDIYAKTLGIIGMGRIGQAVAKRAFGFGMKVIYYRPGGVIADLPFPAEAVELSVLLQNSDFLSIHTPLTSATRHLIGEAELKQMKPTAVLINTSRGAILKESALVTALQNKTIFAAGLDVYEFEPDVTAGLAALPNVVLAPHIGSASIETRTRMAMMTAENAITVYLGKEPPARITIGL